MVRTLFGVLSFAAMTIGLVLSGIDPRGQSLILYGVGMAVLALVVKD